MIDGDRAQNKCGGAGAWQRQWASDVAAFTPDVVVVQAGAWDVFDVAGPTAGRRIPAIPAGRPGTHTTSDALRHVGGDGRADRRGPATVLRQERGRRPECDAGDAARRARIGAVAGVWEARAALGREIAGSRPDVVPRRTVGRGDPPRRRALQRRRRQSGRADRRQGSARLRSAARRWSTDAPPTVSRSRSCSSSPRRASCSGEGRRVPSADPDDDPPSTYLTSHPPVTPLPPSAGAASGRTSPTLHSGGSYTGRQPARCCWASGAARRRPASRRAARPRVGGLNTDYLAFADSSWATWFDVAVGCWFSTIDFRSAEHHDPRARTCRRSRASSTPQYPISTRSSRRCITSSARRRRSRSSASAAARDRGAAGERGPPEPVVLVSGTYEGWNGSGATFPGARSTLWSGWTAGCADAVLHGTADAAVRLSQAQHLEAALRSRRDVEAHYYEGAGHNLAGEPAVHGPRGPNHPVRVRPDGLRERGRVAAQGQVAEFHGQGGQGRDTLVARTTIARPVPPAQRDR